MPSVTYLNTDGEIIRLGGRENHLTAVMFYDRSGADIVFGAPVTACFAFDVGTVRAALISGTVGGCTTFNPDGIDVDFSIQGNNNLTVLSLNAGEDAIGFGTAVFTGAFMSGLFGAQARDMIDDVGMAMHWPADTICANVSGCDTIPEGSFYRFGRPTLTGLANTLTVTDLATVLIENAPNPACNVTGTRVHALLVPLGDVTIGIVGGSGGNLNFSGTTDSITKFAAGASPANITYTWPQTDPGACDDQLSSTCVGVMSWTAKASMGFFKDLLGLTCRKLAYDRIKHAKVYDYNYKDEFKDRMEGGHTPHPFAGVIGEEAPWAMQGRKNRNFSPISAFGNLTVAFQVLNAKVEALEAQLSTPY